MINRLRYVQQSGELVGIMESSGGLCIEVSDPDSFSSLAAGGDSFDDKL